MNSYFNYFSERLGYSFLPYKKAFQYENMTLYSSKNSKTIIAINVYCIALSKNVKYHSYVIPIQQNLIKFCNTSSLRRTFTGNRNKDWIGWIVR